MSKFLKISVSYNSDNIISGPLSFICAIEKIFTFNVFIQIYNYICFDAIIVVMCSVLPLSLRCGYHFHLKMKFQTCCNF